MKSKILPSYNKERTELGKILPLDTPFTVIIDSSEICNFKCNYCFRSNEDGPDATYAKQEGLMKWNTFIKIVDQLKEFPNEVKRISLSGHGEPLCNKLLPDMISYIKKSGLAGKVEIHTNGSLLVDDKFRNRLADSGLDRIIISLQGLNAYSYKEISDISIDFDRFYNSIKDFYICAKNTNVNIKIADIALSEYERNKFYQMFSDIGDRVYIEKIVPLFKDVDYSNIIVSDKKINKYGSHFGEQRCCNQVFYTLFITPEGNIYPCAELDPPLRLGNVNKKTLVEAWNCKVRKGFLKKNLISGYKSHPKCKDCYIPYNNVKVKKDIIDHYSKEILVRLQ
ncbi:MAG: radical SAM protein [Vallitalea sp.]|jgi:radical SAM protein with 4Fe4S-binding SPASM domain|nr:radical SAM protein [Vallitalea sp.]